MAARKCKCWYCEDRFPDSKTTITKVRTGGSYKRAGVRAQPVRACYRCIAQASYHEAVTNGWVNKGLNPRWRVAYPFVFPDGIDHWTYFNVLWPNGCDRPQIPDQVPEYFHPPTEEGA
jgi:hypothetical protein